MKKILFLSPLPPPYYGSAISSRICLDILREYNGFEVENIKLNYSTEISGLGKINSHKLYGIIHATALIRRLMRSFDPEIVYFVPATFGFGLIRDYFFLRIIRMSRKRKIVLHIRAQFKDKDWKSSFKKFLIKGILHCDKVILLGPELIKNLNQAVPGNKIYILPNAIPETLSNNELDRIIKQRNECNELHLLFLSTMWKFKGWHKLLEVCNLLTNSSKRYSCHFVGDWPLVNESKMFFNYIENNNLNKNITFHGQLLNEDKKRILMESNVLVLPTEFDTSPRCILEAMEFGMPVISTKVGTIPSLIEHGKTGFILEKNTPDEIYGYILKLSDLNCRNTLGINARMRFLEKFTLDSYKDRFIKIIKED